MPNKQEVTIAALRRVAGRCEYLDEANALRELADSIEGNEELGGLAAQLQKVTDERDQARKARDDAHAQADVAQIRLNDMQTIADGFRAERDELQGKYETLERETRSLRARVLVQAGEQPPAGDEEPAQPPAEPQPS